jgi:nicotinamide mononucleotide transporter
VTGTVLTIPLAVEILATGANLVYIILLVREHIACWAFGIVGCMLSIYLFADARLYSEAILYFFYTVMGVWGWAHWHRHAARDSNPVVRRRRAFHLVAILAACILATALGHAMAVYSDAERPLFDAFTTVFSFLGTYLEITKVLEAWLYWLVINLASVWLYHDRSLDIYALLIGFYSILSVWGFLSWRRSYIAQRAA